VRRAGEIGLEQTLELEEGLVVEDHRVEVGEREALRLEHQRAAVRREALIVPAAREALLLRGRGHAPVDDQGRRGIVIVCG